MKIHVVQLGDTLWKIAKKHDVDHEALKKMNKQLTSPESLKPGMKVKVPTGGFPVKKKKMAKEAPKSKKEAPKYKKEAPKMKKPVEKKMEKTEPKKSAPGNPEPKKQMKKEPSGEKPMNEQQATEPPRPNPMNVNSQNDSMPVEGWAHHYPPNGLPNNWPAGEGPQMSGAYHGPNANQMHPDQVSPAHYDPNANPMMHPEQVSPAHYGPNVNPMMHPGQVSPAHYGPNANPMMHPGQVSPAHYGPNANPMMHPGQVSPAHYGPNANPMMHPGQVSPAHYGPNANPMMNTMPMSGSKCGCGNHFPQGVMPMHQGPAPYPHAGMWGEHYVPPMPEMEGMPSQMPGREFQPQYWEPNNDGDLYGMMPAVEPDQRESWDDESNNDS